LKTIRARVEDLKKDSRIKYLSIFKNHGLNAGATQSHPHSQIIGMPILPIAKKELLQ
jgi:UDPglucose--hexose-1-phosphate uridylyltransferase